MGGWVGGEINMNKDQLNLVVTEVEAELGKKMSKPNPISNLSNEK